MRKKTIISLFTTLTVCNVTFAVTGPVDFAETQATVPAVNTNTIRVSATPLAAPELPADVSPVSPSETPMQSLDEEPGELGSTPGANTGPIDDALIESDASPAVNLERPLQPGDRVLAPPPVTPPPDRLTVSPPGAPILPTLKPIGPADENL